MSSLPSSDLGAAPDLICPRCNYMMHPHVCTKCGWVPPVSAPIPCVHCGLTIEWVARWGGEYWVHVKMPDGMRTGGYIYCLDENVPGSLLHVAEPPLSPDSGRKVVAEYHHPACKIHLGPRHGYCDCKWGRGHE